MPDSRISDEIGDESGPGKTGMYIIVKGVFWIRELLHYSGRESSRTADGADLGGLTAQLSALKGMR